MLRFMAISLLILVYFILFTDVLPQQNSKYKYIYVITTLLFSAFLFFVAPTLYKDIL